MAASFLLRDKRHAAIKFLTSSRLTSRVRAVPPCGRSTPFVGDIKPLSLIEIMEPPMIEFMGPFFHRFLPPAGT